MRLLQPHVHRGCKHPAERQAGVLLSVQRQPGCPRALWRARRTLPLQGGPGRDDANDTSKDRDRLRRLRMLLEGKAEERSKVVGLYRRGRLNDSELDQQMQEIDKDAAGLSLQIEEVEAKLCGTESNGAVLEGAEALLTRLRKRLDQPLTFERKRQLVELLVAGIRIETIRDGAKRENVVTVTYRFPSAVEVCTDMDSSPPPA